MNITVINGTEKCGVTYRLKEMFLAGFTDKANVTEYYLPKDCPNFCKGCISCLLKGENTCKDAEYIEKIEKSLSDADLIVMTSPAYVYHVTGAKSTAKDIKHSLSWWGISNIGIFTDSLMSDIVWERLSEKKKVELTSKIEKLSQSFVHIDYKKPAHTNLITKIKFLFCRMMQQSLHKNNPEYLDGKYWAEQGWLGKARPWK